MRTAGGPVPVSVTKDGLAGSSGGPGTRVVCAVVLPSVWPKAALAATAAHAMATRRIGASTRLVKVKRGTMGSARRDLNVANEVANPARLSGLRSVPRDQPEVLPRGDHHVTRMQLAPAPGLRLAVHEDGLRGQEGLYIAAALHRARELEELTQPDHAAPDRYLSRHLGRRWRLGGGLCPARQLHAGALVQLQLAQAHGIRGDLHALVLAEELEGLIEREPACRYEAHEHVRGGGADVCEVLLLHGVHVQVVGPGVLADDHPLVHVLAGANEQRAALLEPEEGKARRLAEAIRPQRAGRACAQLAGPRFPALEDVVQDAGSARLGEELRAKADQAAGRNQILHPDPAGA